MLLNKPQRFAVSHRDGPALVIAGPGSGKTAVITRRALALTESGVPPENILVVTFSRAAAREMQIRFDRLSPGFLPVTFGTLHSVFLKILCRETNLNSKNVISDGTRRKILRNVLLKNNSRYDLGADYLDSLLGRIGLIKSGAPGAAGEGDAFYRLYQAELRRMNKVDFDDIILVTKKLFMDNPRVLKVWREKYRYIMVDEFQDVSRAQYDVLRMLAAPANNLFAVGDDDQSIYGFRGAGPGIMLGLKGDYPELVIFTLNVNYRCGAKIVDAAGNVISHNSKRYEKNLTAEKEFSSAPVISSFENCREQYEYIAEKIKTLAAGGVPYREIAVLNRTIGADNSLAEMLEARGVPYIVLGERQTVYGHWIAEDMASYLRILSGGKNRADYLRIINRPLRYIRRDYFAEAFVDEDKIIGRAGSERERRDLRVFFYSLKKGRGLSPYAALSYIRNYLGYERYLTEYAAECGKPAENLIAVVDRLSDSAYGVGNAAAWFKKLERLKREEAAFVQEEKPDENAVLITTIHRSKGLEFETVFIPDACEGALPHIKAVTPDETEEERRLFYVAVTRAKRFLFITYPKKRRSKTAAPSRFLSEMKEPYQPSSACSHSASSRISSNLSAAISYSSSDSMLVRTGCPSLSSAKR
ncbi:MAG: ATP-dependent helicase [Lachnospiraceae bacterium]|nr:ATP-dependent helicase [Lachnospiraceae bacterium]